MDSQNPFPLAESASSHSSGLDLPRRSLFRNRRTSPRSFYARFGKRLFDLAVAVPALILLSPVMGAIALAVRWKLGSPVLFRHERPGLDGRLFTLLKFRTMTNARSADGRLLPDEQRKTRLGTFLRATSLDELPELFNVVRGEMSLVGPRPLMARYLSRYTREQMRRHDTRPGITGWAQVNGRNLISWERKFRLDVWYVERRSFRLDLEILFWTLWTVIAREGVSAPDHFSSPEFMGMERVSAHRKDREDCGELEEPVAAHANS